MEQSLTSYRIFYEVASSGNISRAARKLDISQPAVSKSVSRLEKELGLKLLQRGSRGVRLTAEGELLYGRLTEAFNSIRQGEEELRQLREYNIGHLKIGGSTTLCKYVLMPYLREYLRNYPYVKIAIDNQATSETIRKVENGSIDVGLVVISGSHRAVHFHKLMDVEEIFVCTPEYMNHLQTIYGKDVDVFREANFLLLFKDNDTRKHVDEYFRNTGKEPRRIMEVSTMDLLIDFARIGMGIASVDREFVLQELHEGTLIQIPMGRAVPRRQAGFVYLEDNQNESLRTFLASTV